MKNDKQPYSSYMDRNTAKNLLIIATTLACYQLHKFQERAFFLYWICISIIIWSVAQTFMYFYPDSELPEEVLKNAKKVRKIMYLLFIVLIFYYSYRAILKGTFLV